MKIVSKNKMILSLTCFLLVVTGCTHHQSKQSPISQIQPQNDFGVLIMAHGGKQEWNQGVLTAVAPLKEKYSVEVAFGMADAVSLQTAVEKLEARGVNKVAVVRMYISGESWYERTQKILGITEGAPKRPTPENRKPAAHHGHSMEFWRLETDARFVMSQQGLSEAPEMNQILLFRAKQLSQHAETEDLLILAHGPGDDDENQRWLKNITERTSDIHAALPFRRVKVETLREDWSGKRPAAEKRIRSFVQKANKDKGSAIVIPYRVQGFGPYAEVLNGLAYTANETGLVPHKNVTMWIERQIEELKGGFEI